MALVIQSHYRYELDDGCVIPDRVLMGVSISGTLEVDPDLFPAVFGVPLYEIRRDVLRLYSAELYGKP